ncbi:MAG TPA: NAD(P)-binding protein [archaeon]|nr:NAD(P)-binding protein [archaeon]
MLTPRERRFVFGLNFIEIFLVIIAINFTVSVSITEKAGNSFEESALWTACAMTYSHCEIPIIYNRQVNIISIFNAIIGGAILIMIIWTLAERLLEVDIRVLSMKRKISTLKNHYIVCGYGRVGEHVCEILAKAKKDFVVIDKKIDSVASLRDAGYAALEGDALNPKTLEKAGIDRAKGLIAVLGTDSDNLFLTLTANEINPNLTIAARAHSESVVPKLHKAGAQLIVLPEVTGGLELGREILKQSGSHAGKLISRHKKK